MLVESANKNKMLDKLDSMGVQQLVMLDKPLRLQFNNYKYDDAYMVYLDDEKVQYFDGSNFRSTKYKRVEDICKSV